VKLANSPQEKAHRRAGGRLLVVVSMDETIMRGPRAAHALVMGSKGAGTLPCRAGDGWFPKGQARPLVDGVWGAPKAPRWCEKARCRFSRQCLRDATGERSVSLAKIGQKRS
jgi:hypothetical protein